MGNVLTYIVEGFGAMGIAFYYSWKLTLVIFASVPVMFITVNLVSRNLQPNITRQNDALWEASKISNTAISQISFVKCFNTQGKELLQYVAPVMEAAKFYVKQMRIVSFQAGFVKFITATIFIQGLWYGNVLIHDESFTAGKVVTTFWATLMGVQAFQTLLPPLITLEKGRVASGALLSVLSTLKRGRRVAQHEKGLYPDYCEGDIHVSGVRRPPSAVCCIGTDSCRLALLIRHDQSILCFETVISAFLPGGRRFSSGDQALAKARLGIFCCVSIQPQVAQSALTAMTRPYWTLPI